MGMTRRLAGQLGAAAGGTAVLGGAALYAVAHFLGVPVTALLADRAAALSGRSVPMPGLALPPLSPRYWTTVAGESRRQVATYIRGISGQLRKNRVAQSDADGNDGE
jgi:hypothetical protein